MRSNKLLPAAIFLFIAAGYWLERGRNPGWGDSLGFLVAALEGFSWSVNATGHFLYGVVNTLVLSLFLESDPVSLLTAASIAFAIIACWQVYRTALLITGDTAASLAGTAVLAFSFTFWRQAVSIEVYPLHLALIAAFLRTATRDLTGGERKRFDWAGPALGLALLVHIQTVLLLPAFAYWSYSRGNDHLTGLLRPWGWIASSLLILAIPAAASPDLTVASVFVDFRFAGQVFALDPRVLATGLVKSVVYLIYNFHLFLPLMTLGATRLFRENRRLFILYSTVFIPVWGFAFRYPISDNYVFFLPAYLVLALAGAYGFSAIFEMRRPWKRLPVIAAVLALTLSPALYGAAVLAAETLPFTRDAFEPVRYKGGASYYLWPGLRNTPDPLALVREQYPKGARPPCSDAAAWENLYPRAVQYLRLTGKLQ